MSASPHPRPSAATAPPVRPMVRPGVPGRADPPVALRCFGSLGLWVGGAEVDLTGVRPRSRSVLALLALRAGHRVHTDELTGAFWPDAPPGVARHRLQVAVSELRRCVAGALPADAVQREGDGYRLHLGPGAVVDVARFDALLAAAPGSADPEAAWWEALALHGWPLLADEGAASWVVEGREVRRERAARAAEALALRRRAAGDPMAVVDAATAGLAVDRYRDLLWRLRHEALSALGLVAAAARTEVLYAAVLADLGLPPQPLGRVEVAPARAGPGVR